MSENATLEQRVAALEKLVMGIQQTLAQRDEPRRGVSSMVGALKDIPESDFRQFMDCVREFREEVDAEESAT